MGKIKFGSGICYLFILKVIVFVISLGECRIWARNSFVLGYFSASSDLDLTLFIGKRNSCPTLLLVMAQALKKFGEWNVYSEADREFLEFANPFELARDPQLVSLYGKKNDNPLLADGLAFWARMLAYDKKLFSGSASRRNEKWAFHRDSLASMNLPVSASQFPVFLFESLEILSLKTITEKQLFGEPKRESKCLFFAPQVWLGEARRQNWKIAGALKDELGQLKDALSEIQLKLLRELCIAQIKWEAWGLLGQVRLDQNYQQVEAHLKLLFSILEGESSSLTLPFDRFFKHLASFQK